MFDTRMQSMQDVSFGDDPHELAVLANQGTSVTSVPHQCHGRAETIVGGQLMSDFQSQLPHESRLQQCPELDFTRWIRHGRQPVSEVRCWRVLLQLV